AGWAAAAVKFDGRQVFRVGPEDLSSVILDCCGGPASFNAEMTARGCRVISVDPIYSYSGAEIRGRFEATLPTMLSQVRATLDDWTWSFHRDPDDLCANRRAVMERFLA